MRIGGAAHSGASAHLENAMQNACTSMNRSWTAGAGAGRPSANPALLLGHQKRTVNNAVPDEALQEDANQADEPVLHVLVLARGGVRVSGTSNHVSNHRLLALMTSHEEMQLEM
jgi:hypothetical protein